MKKNFVTSALLLVSLVFTACNSQEKSSGASVQATSPDSEKLAYVFGMQFGKPVFGSVPLQVGEGLSEDVLLQGFKDARHALTDSTFKLQLTDSTLQAIGLAYSQKAQKRFQAIQPDSAMRAKMPPQQIQLYLDSMLRVQGFAPEAKVTGKAVQVSAASSDIEKFSYMFGVNFSSQFEALKNQMGLELSESAFVTGVTDGHKAVMDTSYKGIFSKDTLEALNKRYAEYVKAAQEKARAEMQKEQEKLKQKIAPLRGDTLPDGMPVKMNFAVNVEGINVAGENNLQAYAGKPLLIFYFSPTCGHCHHAAPEVQALANEFKKDGLTALAVSSGGHPKKSIRQFIENVKLEFPVYLDVEREFGELYSDGYVPKVYLVRPDASYKIYKSFEKERDSLKVDIQKLLQEVK